MSGPKVVRVITREEIVAICEGHLARLEEVVEAWARNGRRHGTISEDEISATMCRKEALRALLAGDKFVELQREVPAEIAFLRADAEERQERAIRAAANAGETRRRLAENALTLMNALAQENQVISDDLANRLQATANGKLPNKEAEIALSQAFAIKTSVYDQSATISDRQRELAKTLSVAQTLESYTVWRNPQTSVNNRDGRIQQIDRYIAELETLDGIEVAAPFLQRSSSLSREPDASRHDLLMDSLVVDLADVARIRRSREKTLSDLRELRAELRRFDGDAIRDMVAAIDNVAENWDAKESSVLLERASFLLNAEVKRMANEARRKAILQGLVSLGYEVREGMSTAWAKDGKVVLRKAMSPGYGVELGSIADAERMQVRVVAFSATRDTSRDRDMETIWCSEFTRLQELIKKAGGTLQIEKAHAVGAVPVKTVEGMLEDLTSSHEGTISKTRSQT